MREALTAFNVLSSEPGYVGALSISTAGRLEMRGKLGAVALSIALAAGSAGVIGAATAKSGPAPVAAKKRKPVEFEAHDLYIETNATDGDAGLQLFADAEDWKSFTLLDPHGKSMVDVKARGRARRFGLSELFVEASEPAFTEFPFRKFKKRFPEGTYRFRGTMADGTKLVGSDRLSHLVPHGPKVTSPTKGAEVDRNSAKVTWEPVTRPAGVHIVTYQVIIDQGGRELSMYLPSSATSATIAPEFLQRGAKTGGEVLARERSGNQTITEIPSFTIR